MEADIIVSCPYNPAHRIRKYKLMSHMAKCKKSSHVVDKAECPIDKSHIVDRHLLEDHIRSCPSLGKLTFIDSGYNKPTTSQQPPTDMNAYHSTENWEEEPEVPRYNPMEVSSKKPVLRCVSGLTKSEKRKFKESERMRMANLKGFNSTSKASFSMRDTGYENEVPLRPPRNTTVSPTKISQNFNNSTQIHDNDNDDGDDDDDDDDHDASMQTRFVPEFHNNSFHKMLYDELAPEDDSIKQLEQSLRSTDKISLKDYFEHVGVENGSFSISDRSQDKKVEKTEADTASKLFNIDNKKKERDEHIASTSSASNDRVTDKLLALLKNESSIQKKQPMEEVKIDQMNKVSDKTSALDEMLSKYNERLAYLTEIQNTAAKESAQILEQLKELKLREETALRK